MPNLDPGASRRPRATSPAHARRPALAATARIAPIDGGLIAETEGGAVVFACDLPVERGERLIALLDGRATPAEIAAAMGLSRRDVRGLVRELEDAGLLAASRRGEPRRARHDDIVLAGLGALGAAVLGPLLTTTTARIWLHDPDTELARACIAAATDRLPATARARLRVVPVLDRAARAAIARRARVAVCCVDQPGALLERIAALASSAGLPLLPVQRTAEGYLIGPPAGGMHRDALDGCALCGELYRRASDPFAQAVADHVARRDLDRVHWHHAADPAAAATAAALVVARLREASAERPGAGKLAIAMLGRGGRAVLVEPGGGAVVERQVIQHPGCRHAPAGDVPASDAAQAERAFAEPIATSAPPLALPAIAARLRPLASPAALGPLYPVQPLSAEQRDRLRAFVAGRGGAPDTSLLAHAHVARTYLPQLDDVAVGVDFLDAGAADALSIIEALERLAVFAPLTPLPALHRRFCDVAAHAIDPASLPLYAEAQYRQPRFAARPHDPDQPIDWLWGIDVRTGEPVLVPADVVRPGRPGAQIALCTSSGAACHSRLPHAILAGLYELIERDAFSIAWMNRLSLPRTALPADPLGLFAEWQALDCELDAVDLTTDLDIPVVLVTCRDRRDPDRFIVTFASGRSPAAVASRLHKELLQFALLAMAGRPRAGAAIADHFLWYQDRQRAPLVAFLTASDERSGFAAHPHFAAAAREAPGEELARLVGQLHACGHRVISVDLTTPWLRSLGLCAVRVVVPGLQPIHFGRGNAVLGGARLYQAPRRMGRRDRDTTPEELNPWPHPFA